MNGENRKRSPAASVLVVLGAMLTLATVYALSMGPMLWLATHGYLSDGMRSVLSKVYEPLWIVAGYIPFLKQLLFWYVGLWD